MKLYATTTSERASKGQGGNEYLNIEITGELKQKLGIVSVRMVDNKYIGMYHFNNTGVKIFGIEKGKKETFKK